MDEHCHNTSDQSSPTHNPPFVVTKTDAGIFEFVESLMPPPMKGEGEGEFKRPKSVRSANAEKEFQLPPLITPITQSSSPETESNFTSCEDCDKKPDGTNKCNLLKTLQSPSIAKGRVLFQDGLSNLIQSLKQGMTESDGYTTFTTKFGPVQSSSAESPLYFDKTKLDNDNLKSIDDCPCCRTDIEQSKCEKFEKLGVNTNETKSGNGLTDVSAKIESNHCVERIPLTSFTDNNSNDATAKPESYPPKKNPIETSDMIYCSVSQAEDGISTLIESVKSAIVDTDTYTSHPTKACPVSINSLESPLYFDKPKQAKDNLKPLDDCTCCKTPTDQSKCEKSDELKVNSNETKHGNELAGVNSKPTLPNHLPASIKSARRMFDNVNDYLTTRVGLITKRDSKCEQNDAFKFSTKESKPGQDQSHENSSVAKDESNPTSESVRSASYMFDNANKASISRDNLPLENDLIETTRRIFCGIPPPAESINFNKCEVLSPLTQGIGNFSNVIVETCSFNPTTSNLKPGRSWRLQNRYHSPIIKPLRFDEDDESPMGKQSSAQIKSTRVVQGKKPSPETVMQVKSDKVDNNDKHIPHICVPFDDIDKQKSEVVEKPCKKLESEINDVFKYENAGKDIDLKKDQTDKEMCEKICPPGQEFIELGKLDNCEEDEHVKPIIKPSGETIVKNYNSAKQKPNPSDAKKEDKEIQVIKSIRVKQQPKEKGPKEKGCQTQLSSNPDIKKICEKFVGQLAGIKSGHTESGSVGEGNIHYFINIENLNVTFSNK